MPWILCLNAGQIVASAFELCEPVHHVGCGKEAKLEIGAAYQRGRLMLPEIDNLIASIVPVSQRSLVPWPRVRQSLPALRTWPVSTSK
jgi:hypothetical protein